MSAPSSDQVVIAARNHRQPPTTMGARVRQALQHVRYSQKEKPSLYRPGINNRPVAGHSNVECCYGKYIA